MSRVANSRGSGMVLSLLAMSVLALLSVVVFRIARSQVRESIYQMRSAQAYYIAETGLEDALHKLSLDPLYRTNYGKSFSEGSYSVAFSTEYPPTVSVTGYSTPIALLGAAVKAVHARGAITYATPYLYSNAGQADFRVNGVADAYDSAVNPAPSSFVFGADVWSNATAGTSASGVDIRGNVWYFSGTAPAAARVEGVITKSTYTATLPYHDGTAYASANDNLTGLSPASVYTAGTKAVSVANGVTATINPGNYYFSSLTVNGTLNVNNAGGAVNVYLTGAWTGTTGGKIVNQSQIPSRFNVYGQGSNASYLLRSTTALHANVEARSADISIRGAFYGKAVGNTVTVTAAGLLHYDKQLGVSPAYRVGWKPGTWTESFDRP